MSEGDGVEAAYAARPEIGRDDLLADVEAGGGGGETAGDADGTAGVDEQGTAFGAGR